MQHTKEPWNGKNIPLTASALERVGFYIVFTNNPATKDEAEANARRIVACVNACEGIPTGVLEKQGMVPIEQVTHDIERQRDKLLATLEGLTNDIHSLIYESSGVAGLHLNGDLAPWHELEAGGRFERLTHLPDAFAAIAEVKGCAK